MTGDRGNRFRLADSKDVPQFAPNFSVYVLPPDVVCLYSEDRKYFLHGDLFCALAPLIGKGGKSFRELVRELERDFPPAGNPRSAQAADRAPLRRPGIARVRRRGGRLLGEPRPAAGDRRAKSPERPRAHPVDRRAGCGRARAPRCEALGVRIVKRSADLTVTLVSDYLDARLERIEPAAPVGPHALAPRPALRHLSPGGAGVPPGQERLLDVPRRSHEAQPRGQGDARPRAGPLRRGLAAGPALARTRRHRSLQRSRSRKRSPPTSARRCAITSSASTCWARPS